RHPPDGSRLPSTTPCRSPPEVSGEIFRVKKTSPEPSGRIFRVEKTPPRASGRIFRVEKTSPSAPGEIFRRGMWRFRGEEGPFGRSEEHTSELQSRENLVC